MTGPEEQMGAVAPYVTVVIAAFAPLAAGLYLITTLAWTITERWLFLRRARRESPPQRQHQRG